MDKIRVRLFGLGKKNKPITNPGCIFFSCRQGNLLLTSQIPPEHPERRVIVHLDDFEWQTEILNSWAILPPQPSFQTEKETNVDKGRIWEYTHVWNNNWLTSIEKSLVIVYFARINFLEKMQEFQKLFLASVFRHYS